jgi:redox-sensitive bicupin YhaK (pirin superfamily)
MNAQAMLVERNVHLYDLNNRPAPEQKARGIALKTRGRGRGGITRLVSPSDIGERIKPFVFLDRFEIAPGPGGLIGIHPHSGIATLTTVLHGGMFYEDTTGKTGKVPTGGLEWMKAGSGVWHDGGGIPGEVLRGFQLWVALPAEQENSAPESQYIDPEQVQSEGPVRVILGSYGAAHSVIRAPEGINYFHVHLKDGESWSYLPPAGHNVAWLAVDGGRLRATERIDAGELAVFEEGNAPIELKAVGDTSFVLGSAVKHPHPLVLGNYSVHTSEKALAQGEAEIERIGWRLRAAGRI